jgi:hypothetical protein
MPTETAYQRHGFANREAYLRDLANENNLDFNDVSVIAQSLGAGEDFDGLVMAIQDYCDMLVPYVS